MLIIYEKKKEKEEGKEEASLKMTARTIAIPRRRVKSSSSSNEHDLLPLLVAAAEVVQNEDKAATNAIIQQSDQQRRKRRYGDADLLKPSESITRPNNSKKHQRRTLPNAECNNAKKKPARKGNEKSSTMQQISTVEPNFKVKRNVLHAYISYKIYCDLTQGKTLHTSSRNQ
ncbi:MAG: hypothetical protein EXX96DRAFT_249100 [Benjaminiella poitrasii]|nr:MAG: hypothetical protein EXX96DRAFT_249100 [Benjaminiella poitrasii]